MTGGRRVLLSAGFLALAALLGGPAARAQDRSHQLWQQNLTPEQVKAALARMGAGEAGDLDPFQQMIKDHFLKNNPQFAKDPALQEAVKKLTANKQLMESLRQYAK